MRELNLFGIYVAPFILYVVAAAVIFFPVKLGLDWLGVDRFIWHRPLFDVALFVCTVSAITLLAGPRGIWLS